MSDAEARIRALTREVGSVREDLRRETKRRERAVAQAKEAEVAKCALERQNQELGYANRKLAAELDAAHDAARTASERDKRALQNLRDGLASVEAEVSSRALKSQEVVSSAFVALEQLRSTLLEPPGVTVLGPSLSQQVTEMLADAMQPLNQLTRLLAGSGSGPEFESDSRGGDKAGAGMGAGTQHGGSVRVGVVQRGLMDVEKQQLLDEVARLRSQLRALVDKAAGAAGAATQELQSLLRDAQAEAVTLRAEVAHLHSALTAATQQAAAATAEADALQASAVQQGAAACQAESSVAQISAANAQLMAQVGELRHRVAELEAALESARHSNAGLAAQVEEGRRRVEQETSRAAALQARLSGQHADMRAALDLVASSAQQVRAAAAASVAPQQPLAQPPQPQSSQASSPSLLPLPLLPMTLLGMGADGSGRNGQQGATIHGHGMHGPTAQATTATGGNVVPHIAASAAAAHHLLKSELLGVDVQGPFNTNYHPSQPSLNLGPHITGGGERAAVYPLGAQQWGNEGQGSGKPLFQGFPSTYPSQLRTGHTVTGIYAQQGGAGMGMVSSSGLGGKGSGAFSRVGDQNKPPTGQQQGQPALTTAATAAAIAARLRAQQAEAAAAAGSIMGVKPSGMGKDFVVPFSPTKAKVAAISSLGARVAASLTDAAGGGGGGSEGGGCRADGRQPGAVTSRTSQVPGQQQPPKGPRYDALRAEMQSLDAELQQMEAALMRKQ